MNETPLLEAIWDTAPVATTPVADDDAPAAPVGIHFLLGRGDTYAALWSLKSFYHFSCVRYPLTLHCQGDFSQDDLILLQHHFPYARVISQSEANACVDPWLTENHWECMRAQRRADFLLQRITDFYFFGQSVNILAFDSDVLFFQTPKELLMAERSPLGYQYFQRDCADSYTISLHRAIRELGIFLLPRLNCGITLAAREALNPARYEHLLQHPALAERHWHREQTLRALAACAGKRARYLPASYVLRIQATTAPGEWVARHYVSPIREQFLEEGIARLRQNGFLNELA